MSFSDGWAINHNITKGTKTMKHFETQGIVAPTTMEHAADSHDEAVKAIELANTIAMLIKDQERRVDDPEPYDMTSDDAVETLHSLISAARDLTGNGPNLIEET